MAPRPRPLAPLALAALAAACNFPRPADVGDDAAPDDAELPGTVVHVSPTGDDKSDGLTAPVRTLKRAILLAGTNTAITTISLGVGRYAAADGETYPYVVPPSVTIEGPSPGGVVLVGTRAQNALAIDSGTLRNLEFEDFLVAVVASGTLTGENLHVRTSKLALRGDVAAKISLNNMEIAGAVDMCGTGVEINGNTNLSVVKLIARNLFSVVAAKDHSIASIVNAEVTGDPLCLGPAFSVTSDKMFSLADGSVVGMYRGVTVVGAVNSPAHIRLTNASFRSLQGDFLNGAYAEFEMVGGEISRNPNGITGGSGTWTLTNVRISDNAGTGIYVSGTTSQSPATLFMRGCVVVNNRDGVELFDWSLGDLGTSANPGGNTFQANQYEGVVVSGATGPMQVDAVGNTWNANVQGADAAGRYPVPATVSGPIAQAPGINYDIWAGLSLRR